MTKARGENVLTRPQYWAFNANPNIYRIEEAVRDLETDLWTVKDHAVEAGDRVIIWKSKGGTGGKRGVVALGEVITDPDLCQDAGNPYWVDQASGRTTELRVRVRYVLLPLLPLWLGISAQPVLERLTVSRAQGGTVFKVTEEQWGDVVEAAGGWPTR